MSHPIPKRFGEIDCKGCQSLRAEVERLKQEIDELRHTPCNTIMWETRYRRIKQRIEDAPVVWMSRSPSSDDHWLFPSHPNWDEENEEWRWDDGNQLYLGAFNSKLKPGESCKVRLLREASPCPRP